MRARSPGSLRLIGRAAILEVERLREWCRLRGISPPQFTAMRSELSARARKE